MAFDGFRERRLTDFTLKALPNVRVDDGTLLELLLTVEPFSQARGSDPLDSALALAWGDQLMIYREVLFRQTDPTHRSLRM